jgi:hypothetical protein
MPRAAVALLSALLIVWPAAGAEQPSERSAADDYKALVEEFEESGSARQFAPRFFEFSDKYSKDPAAIDALLWIVANRRNHADATRALDLLAERHISSERLGPACDRIARTPSLASEKLLRLLLEKSPHLTARAQACYHLAQLLEGELRVLKQLRQQPELAGRVLQYYGKEYGQHLAALKETDLTAELEIVYERLVKSFADAKAGEIGQNALFRIRHLSVGRVAPEIKGRDIAGKAFSLSDYRGKVVVLTFWGHW